jgi:hypothetical protein
VGTLRREFLDRIVIFNEAHTHAVLTAFIHYYNRHRPHQSPQQLPPQTAKPPTATTLTSGTSPLRPATGGSGISSPVPATFWRIQD